MTRVHLPITMLRRRDGLQASDAKLEHVRLDATFIVYRNLLAFDQFNMIPSLVLLKLK